MNTQHHVINASTTRLRLTKSPISFVAITFLSSLLILGILCALAYSTSGSLYLHLGVFGISMLLLILIMSRLAKVSEAFIMTDMVIVKPFFGKKLISPIQGVVLKKSSTYSVLPICKVYIRLDGKKTIHYFYGKCEELVREKLKTDDYLAQLKKSKKVNHKPGSVSSVA